MAAEAMGVRHQIRLRHGVVLPKVLVSRVRPIYPAINTPTVGALLKWVDVDGFEIHVDSHL